MFSSETIQGTSFLLHTDIYKVGHHRMMDPRTTRVFSNYTNRTSRVKGIDKVVNFGVQGFLEELRTEYSSFLKADVDEVVAYYESIIFNAIGLKPDTAHIRDLHAYGLQQGDDEVPIMFAMVPEGTEVPLRVPTLVFWNTVDRFAWLTNYLETWLSSSIWHPSTVATLALDFRRLLNEWALKTTGSTDGVEYQGHDFSYRGLTGTQAAGASGAAHLLSFNGSDNLEAYNYLARAYPGEDYSESTVLNSVLASEHSVMCAGTAVEGEYELYERLLTENPTGIISLVSDTYDLWNVLTEYLPKLKALIMSRDGKLVIRPDSGNPVDIICGSLEPANSEGFYKLPSGGISDMLSKQGDDTRTPAETGVIELLWSIFGGTVNAQGYKELDPHIGAIYGDSITYERAQIIMERLAAKGFASTNVVFGVGSYRYQYVTRDTFGSAVKATAVTVAGEEYPIFKDPITDNGTKRSAKGYLKVYYGPDGELKLEDGLTAEQFMCSVLDDSNVLQPVLAPDDLGNFSGVRALVRENM